MTYRGKTLYGDKASATKMIEQMLTEDGARLPEVYGRAIADVVASDPRLTRIAEAIAEAAAARADRK